MKYIFLVCINLIPILFSYGQCPVSEFSLDPLRCKNNSVSLSNNSTDAITYHWDFDAGDLSNTPLVYSVIDNIGSSTPTNIEIASDGGNWYGFVSSRGNSKIIRLDFGTDLSSTPTVSALTITGLSTPEGFQLYQEAGNWYALVLNSGSSTLSRIDFGSSLASDNLTATGLVTAGAINSTMNLVQSSDSLIVTLTNFSSETISFIPFGNSITNTPTSDEIFTTTAISGLTDIIGLDVFYECGNWHGIVNGFTNKAVLKLDFGPDLFSNPTTSVLANSTLLGGSNPIRTNIEREGGKYIAIVSSRNGHIYRFDLGTENNISLVDSEDLGSYSTLDRLHAFTLIEDESKWYAFGVNTATNALYRIDFPNQSSQSSLTSTLTTPTFSYEEEGGYTVQLKSIDANGQISFSSKTITIDDGPTVEFNSTGHCVNSSISFAGSSSNTITNWSWNFGDGSPLSTGATTDHTYTTAGDYSVTLTATREDGCSSELIKTVRVVDDTPTANYNYSSSDNCSFTDFTFTNDTNDTGIEDIVSYLWDFNGEATSTNKNPTYAFATPGDKTITLTATIPGCSTDTYSENITISEGPNVSFDYTNNCFGKDIQFTDQTTGNNITSYSWNFGDGTPTSTDQNPTHLYAATGEYDITLTVANDGGCQNASLQSITVSD
ncbi:PKD domain-containing protein, partial [Reichenbachiella sp. MSK19-1]|uniref:PKD domain-containing protein n=1 Tax=Reichenbachiella sp. MSK19-1 TaxID=1897631 RepID=UPI000E6C6988